jgi:hypothetical protein
MPLLLAAAAVAWIVAAIEPFPVGILQDDGIYTVLAKSIATGQGYRYLHMPDVPNATHFPPLYALLLAGLWKLSPSFPANVVLFKFANAVLVALAAMLGWRFARRRLGMGPYAAALTVGAFTVCTPIVLLSVMVLSEPMFLAALFPVLLACERAAETGRKRDALVAGAAGGILALVRTLGAVAIPATALVLAWRRRVAAVLVHRRCPGDAAVAAVVAAHAAEVPPVSPQAWSYRWLVRTARRPSWVSGSSSQPCRWSGRLGDTFGDTLPEWVRGRCRWSLRCLPRVAFAARAQAADGRYVPDVRCHGLHAGALHVGHLPLVGMVFGVAIEAVVAWRPQGRLRIAVRRAGLVLASLLAMGYVRYNYVNTTRGWWTQMQSTTADRARPLAEWVVANTPEDAVLATDDDVLIHLYTGRHTIPNGTFTPQDHLRLQTPEFAAEALRTILRTYHVDYVLASSVYGTNAVRGLMEADPPELRFVGALKVGAIFRTLPRSKAP